jgi:hypothetical protein
MNLSKEIDQQNLDKMLSFKEELKLKSKEIGQLRFLPELYKVMLIIPVSGLLKIKTDDIILFYN